MFGYLRTEANASASVTSETGSSRRVTRIVRWSGDFAG